MTVIMVMMVMMVMIVVVVTVIVIVLVVIVGIVGVLVFLVMSLMIVMVVMVAVGNNSCPHIGGVSLVFDVRLGHESHLTRYFHLVPVIENKHWVSPLCGLSLLMTPPLSPGDVSASSSGTFLAMPSLLAFRIPVFHPRPQPIRAFIAVWDQITQHFPIFTSHFIMPCTFVGDRRGMK